jgi:hypothetical protein
MPRVPKAKKAIPERIAFEVDSRFKQAVSIALAEHRISLKEAGRIAFARYLKISLPEESVRVTASPTMAASEEVAHA